MVRLFVSMDNSNLLYTNYIFGNTTFSDWSWLSLHLQRLLMTRHDLWVILFPSDFASMIGCFMHWLERIPPMIGNDNNLSYIIKSTNCWLLHWLLLSYLLLDQLCSLRSDTNYSRPTSKQQTNTTLQQVTMIFHKTKTKFLANSDNIHSKS